MPAGLSPMHLLVIMVVALVVLGPDRLPDAVRSAARFFGEARQWSASMSEELHSAVSMEMSEPSPPTVKSPPTSSGADSGTAPVPDDISVEGSPAGSRLRLGGADSAADATGSQTPDSDAHHASSPSATGETDHTPSFAKEKS
ncbi:MAG: twin-arginine translocase TatA/TatE family subunit [Actinomycetota bacterium]|nr:twin-arginine translocase TatA/TatE family subunit [Actinomycetota bacterium]